MLFNSYIFIFLFLPASLGAYFFLNKLKLLKASKAWLIVSSLLFYGWWNFNYVPLILGSILFNFIIARVLTRNSSTRSRITRRTILAGGIAANLALLGYYKYSGFLISNINALAGTQMRLQNIVLPLGISFFTFTQIAFLIDVFKNKVKEYDFMNYSLFVTFFPHLLAGPILHHKEMMPQFDWLRNKVISYKYLSEGLFLFSIGLFKKVVIADNLAVWANKGFDAVPVLTFIEAWITSLSYTLQLYFDFSGYTDMALGIAIMFNIKLPINFDSPYRSVNIQDFWRRWHITLSRFLREYIYIPLGGNKVSEARTLTNLMATFLLGGMWHGAGWTFVFWGFLHGLAMIIYRVWKTTNILLPPLFSWFITFNFVNIAWIFFRANNFDNAFKVLKGMLGMTGLVLPSGMADFVLIKNSLFQALPWLPNLQGNGKSILMILVFLTLVLLKRNSNELVVRFRPSFNNALLACLSIGLSLLAMVTASSQFIYFNF